MTLAIGSASFLLVHVLYACVKGMHAKDGTSNSGPDHQTQLTMLTSSTASCDGIRAGQLELPCIPHVVLSLLLHDWEFCVSQAAMADPI